MSFIQIHADMHNISGFPEFLPAQQLLFEQWKYKIRCYFEKFGFVPLETPAVERLSTLLAKGDDHEIYGVHRAMQPDSDTSLGLRFDLTVPLARYVAQHQGQLSFPYRRYHIAPVWRGERSQANRYKQFYQCDIDVIGKDQLSLDYDAEVISIMWGLLHTLDLGTTLITLSHRVILEEWIAQSGISDIGAALRLIDKRGKMPFSAITQELHNMGSSSPALDILYAWMDRCQDNTPQVTAYHFLDELMTFSDKESFQRGLQDLKILLNRLEWMHVSLDNVCLDPLLARGLTYYSGTICEMILKDKPHLGAIAAGGRYANLVGTFSQKSFPGVGISFGLSRAFSCELVSLRATTADILITVQAPLQKQAYIQLAHLLRLQGLKGEVYLEDHKLPTQLKYAHAKGFPFVLIANDQEMAQAHAHIKHMSTGKQQYISHDQIASYILS